MKQQDIAILIVIIFFAGIFSFMISTKIVTPTERTEKVEIVEAISSEFNIPSGDTFNAEAINPTVRIKIAPSENNQPFNSAQ